MVAFKKLSIAVAVLMLIGSCQTTEVVSGDAASFKNCPLRDIQGADISSSVDAPEPKLYERSRLIVIISDLHLGFGKNPQTGQWYTEEDFRWEVEFLEFLQDINQRGGGQTDLILNGDTFEIWQSLSNDCSYQNKNLGCTEPEAINRIKIVLRAHSAELNALGIFANSGSNRVILTPGNHDSAILFPKVAKMILSAIPSVDGRVTIANEGYWLSADQLVYVEHGHQIGTQVNCFDKWPAPFVREKEEQYLQRPWGEQFVQKYYNDFEHKYSIIDNISSEHEGVAYGLAAEGPTGTAKAVSSFFKFLLFDISWEQVRASLGEEGETPEWDAKKIREQTGDMFLVESFAKDDPIRENSLIALNQNKLQLKLSDLSDDEIMAICDKRAALRKMGRDIEDCPRKDQKLGAAMENLLRSRDQIFGDHLENTNTLLKVSKKTQKWFDAFIYGHTHRADAGFYPLKGNWNPVVVNSGAFQRVVKPDQLEEIRKSKNLSKKEVLVKITPENLPPCYTVIMINPYEKKPKPELWYWRQVNEGDWGLKAWCN